MRRNKRVWILLAAVVLLVVAGALGFRQWRKAPVRVSSLCALDGWEYVVQVYYLDDTSARLMALDVEPLVEVLRETSLTYAAAEVDQTGPRYSIDVNRGEAVCEMVVFENGTVLYLNAAQTPHVFWRTEDDSLYRAVEALVTEPTE